MYYNQQCNPVQQTCDYFTEETFCNRISNRNIQDGDLSLIHTNIRSSSCNLRKFDIYLDSLNHKFSFIGLSETWLNKHNKDLYGLQGYKGIHSVRAKRRGGGVSIYLKDSIEYFPRNDLSCQNNVMESVFIEVDKDQVNKNKNVVVGVIYRPPNTNISEFN